MTNTPPRYRYRVLRFAVFAIVLALWTWKLLSPNPVPESVSGLIPGDWRFWLAKSLHAGVYAFLTLLALTLPIPRYWRWYFVGLLAFHGAMTEVGQTFVPNRSGSVRDVLLDWLGIASASVCWLWLRKRM